MHFYTMVSGTTELDLEAGNLVFFVFDKIRLTPILSKTIGCRNNFLDKSFVKKA